MNRRMLMIMRHAKADQADHVRADFDRKLTDRGKRDAKKMGAWLKKMKLIPDRIVCSPATRAERTARAVCKETAFDPAAVHRDQRIYDASLEDLLKVVAAHVRGSRCLLLIGHNPGLEELLTYLSRDQPENNSAGKMLTTAAIAVLDYGHKPITAVKGSARLLCLVRPHD